MTPSRPLSPLEAMYFHFYRRRRRRWNARRRIEGCRIVSVGNISTGGTGKTPCVQWLARALQQRNYRPAVIARGYGGTQSKVGFVVSDGQSIFGNARDCGDEPMLHARALSGVPVVIGQDREAAVRRAVSELNCNVAILDDGFQYWSLARDFDLVLLDARRPFDNGKLLPLGRLREPEAALLRAHALLLTRVDRASPDELDAAYRAIRSFAVAPIWESRHAPQTLRDESSDQETSLDQLRGAKIGALSALAGNEEFFASLEAMGAKLVARLARRDHHRWSEHEIRRFSHSAQAQGATMLLTTEKDVVKIKPSWSHRLPLYSLPIALDIARGDELLERIIAALERPAE